MSKNTLTSSSKSIGVNKTSEGTYGINLIHNGVENNAILKHDRENISHTTDSSNTTGLSLAFSSSHNGKKGSGHTTESEFTEQSEASSLV